VIYQEHTAALDRQGWTLIEGLAGQADAEEWLRRFGAIVPQYNGHGSAQVRATGDYANLPVSGSTGGIGPHTDGIAMPTPPRLLALYCIEPAACGGGYTYLANGLDFLSSLDDEAIRYCRTKRFRFRTAGGLLDESEHYAEHSILEDNDASGLRINFSHNYFYWGDLNPVAGQPAPVRNGALARILDAVDTYFRESALPVLIPRNGMLVWDNCKMLHSRGPFEDTSRHLVRYWLS